MNLVDSFVRIVRMSAKLKCLRSATKNLIFLPLLVSAESRPNQTVRSRPEVSAKSFLKGPEVLWWWWPPEEEHFYGQSKATSFRLRLNTGDRPRWSIIALHMFLSLSHRSYIIPYIWGKLSRNMRDFIDFSVNEKIPPPFPRGPIAIKSRIFRKPFQHSHNTLI